MARVDFKKELKHLYGASAKEVSLVEVPEMNSLMIDGTGDPNSVPEFQQAVEALYGISYTLKFMIKKAQATDYVVMPLEGLWWTEDMSQFSIEDKGAWQWTLMIMQPEFVTSQLVEQAIDQVRQKKDPPALGKVRFAALHERLGAQIMHIGPYGDEGPTIEKLHSFIRENGYELTGKHHEVYLSDPRRTAPEKLKTIIRQPVG